MTLSIPDNFNGESPRTKYMSVSNQATTPEPLRNQPDQVVIPLLEERVVVNRRRRKVGEVVVRKEIETYIVKVPIRREKLVVEQFSPEYQQIAVVELGQAQVTEFDNLEAVEVSDSPTVSGEFSSAKAAIYFLEAIASEPDSDLEKVQVRVVLKDAARQVIYQRWLDDYSSDITP